jgi:type I restriction enzyme S subunit
MHGIVSGYANGTTVNMLPPDGLQSPHIVVPPARVVATFNTLAAAVRARNEEMVEECRTLAALRDALLPKLISGELRVNDAERFIARADTTSPPASEPRRSARAQLARAGKPSR